MAPFFRTRCIYSHNIINIRIFLTSSRDRFFKSVDHKPISQQQDTRTFDFFSTTKKLSYRRDSARRLSLRRSKSFKVTDVSVSRKAICDFLLVYNTNLHPVFQFSRSSVKLLPLTTEWLSLMHSFSVTIFTQRLLKTRNTFCGTWYLPHSHVHN